METLTIKKIEKALEKLFTSKGNKDRIIVIPITSDVYEYYRKEIENAINDLEVLRPYISQERKKRMRRCRREHR